MAADGTPLPGWKDLYNNASCGLILVDLAGQIKLVNKTFCDWLGYTAIDLIDQKRFPKLLPMGGQIFLQTHFSPLLQIQRSVAEVKLDFLHADGSTVPMLINCARRRHGEFEFDEISALLVRDRQKYETELLTARRKAEDLSAQLSSADQKKDEFLAMLAHELRNPLAPMRNVVAILKRKDFADPQMSWSRDVLDRQLSFMNHLVDDLLEASRIVQGKIELRLAAVDLTELLRNAAEAARPIMERSAHALRVNFPAEALTFQGDLTRLVQILVNLLNNAAKFTPAGGSIELVGKKERDEIVLTVTDTGVGIAPEKLGEIFEMFSQISSTRGTAQGGLGIGLALVRALATLHDGTVQADSNGPNTGSRFTVRIPIVETVLIDPVAEALDVERISRSLRIVVVDDNDDSATSMSMLLGLSGHDVKTAASGLTGLKLSERLRPQVLLLDIGLPDMTGYELAMQIRQRQWGKDALIIAMTGWGKETDKEKAMSAGFDLHLTKPINVAELEDALSVFSAGLVPIRSTDE